MALDPHAPVLVGAGQVTERADPEVPLTERPEPVELMARALRAAAQDSCAVDEGRGLLARAQSLRVIVPLSWRYVNPGLLVSQRLGIAPPEVALTVIGGNNPQTVVNHTAVQIAEGKLDVALVSGAECIFTRVAARRDPERLVLGWSTQPDDTPRPVMFGTDRVPVTDVEAARGLDRPLPRLPTVRERVAIRSGPDHRRAPAPGVGSVGAVLVGGSDQSIRVVARSPDG